MKIMKCIQYDKRNEKSLQKFCGDFCTLQSEYAISVSAVSHISDLYGVSAVLPDCPGFLLSSLVINCFAEHLPPDAATVHVLSDSVRCIPVLHKADPYAVPAHGRHLLQKADADQYGRYAEKPAWPVHLDPQTV